MIIAIDGPAASGKSTIARRLGEHYNAFYVNSGLLYRALAYVLINKKYALEELAFPDPDDLLWARGICEYRFELSSDARMLVDGVDVTPSLKTPQIDDATSRLSIAPLCRQIVLEWQRSFETEGDLVAEGRDIGSKVFPYADYKFYITASVQVRARRMHNDLKKQGKDIDLKTIEQSIKQRDERDTKRSLAPLVIPAGAHVIDTSDLTVQESVEKIFEIIQKFSK